jgi:hypothetical protein
VSKALTKLNTSGAVAEVHRNPPDDAGEVELDLEVSVVWHW